MQTALRKWAFENVPLRSENNGDVVQNITEVGESERNTLPLLEGA
jgi:hypothetical protein